MRHDGCALWRFGSLAIVVSATIGGPTVLVEPAQAVTITFRNGTNVVSSDNAINIPLYTGTEDMARNAAVGTTNLNYGGEVDFELGESNPGDDLTPYVRFDVSALAGQYQTINSITLRLSKYALTSFDTLPANERRIDAFVVDPADGDWVEGNGLGTPVPGAATYDDRQDGNSLPWNGSDTLALTNQLMPAGSGYQSLSLNSSLVNLTSLVNTWLVAGQNGGLRLGFTNVAGSPRYLAFGAKDNPTNVEDIPELVIDYTAAVPEPATTSLLAMACLVLGARRQARRRATRRE